MKKSLRFTAMALCTTLLVGVTGCGEASPVSDSMPTGSVPSTTTTVPPKTLSEEDKVIVNEIDTAGLDVTPLENPTVKWLSFWDINPVNGKAVPLELEMFKNIYGGNIEYIVTTFDDKYNKLSAMVASGDSPDMFPGADMDGFPRAAANNMFDPLDDYIDFNSPLWDEMNFVNDQFVYQGKHYIASVGTDAGVVMIYNKKTIQNNSLPDPQQLLADSNWTWDTFDDMMNKFCNVDEDKYAVDGWWFVWGFSATTGVPYIGMENGKAVQNLMDPSIAKAQEFMADMYFKNYPYPKWSHGWQINPGNIANGTTLFYPVGIYSLYEADLSAYGKTDEIAFVPMPRCPFTDEYYVPTSIEAYALCKGAKNPEGVAAFLNCKMTVRNDETAKEVGKRQLFEDYGWTDEMYEMLQTVQEITDANPVLDFYRGISGRCLEAFNNPAQDTFNNGTSWTQTRESILPEIQAEIDAINKRLES